jgi:hypothetical protein
MPLAPNMVRLDTHAGGALFVGQAAGQTMKRAVELTLQNGYTHFRLEQASMAQGEQLAGVFQLLELDRHIRPASATVRSRRDKPAGSRPGFVVARQTWQ